MCTCKLTSRSLLCATIITVKTNIIAKDFYPLVSIVHYRDIEDDARTVVPNLTSSLRVVLYRPLINTSAVLLQIYFHYELSSRSIVPHLRKLFRQYGLLLIQSAKVIDEAAMNVKRCLKVDNGLLFRTVSLKLEGERSYLLRSARGAARLMRVCRCAASLACCWLCPPAEAAE
jgi:hypothetical protein